MRGPELTDFSTQYAELSDEELLLIASDRTSLKDDALFALNSEMERRSLTDSDVAIYEGSLLQSGQLESEKRFRNIAEISSRFLMAFRFASLVLINLVAAVIGTAILDTALRRAIPPHGIGAALWKEIALSIICASGIGFGMWRTWRSEPAKWTWVIASLWFAFGSLAIAGHGMFGRLSISSVDFGAAEMRSFFAFTVPLIRAVAYSGGALISSLVYPRTHDPAQ
jgi:hypothetical protein